MAFEGKIKGVHLQNVIDYVKHKKGTIGLNEFIQMVNDGRAYHDIIKVDAIIPKNWYPYELYLKFLRSVDLVTGDGDLSKCYDIGYQTLQNMGHLSYLTRAPVVLDFMQLARYNWNTVYDFGKPTYEVVNDKTIIFIYHGFPEDKAKCEYFRGSLAGMLTLCGLDGEVEELECNTEGADHCMYQITWK